jgi:hypothetical protein
VHDIGLAAIENVVENKFLQLPGPSRNAETVLVVTDRQPEIVGLKFFDVEAPAMVDPQALAHVVAKTAIRDVVFSRPDHLELVAFLTGIPGHLAPKRFSFVDDPDRAESAFQTFVELRSQRRWHDLLLSFAQRGRNSRPSPGDRLGTGLPFPTYSHRRMGIVNIDPLGSYVHFWGLFPRSAFRPASP